MNSLDLLVLGEVNADLILGRDAVPAFGQEERLLDSAELVLGGASAITACGAARLGLRVGFVGLASDDMFGRFVLEQLTAAGVDTRWVAVRRSDRSGLGVILHRSDGDRAILTYPGLIPVFATTDVPAAALASARHIHVGAYFLQTGLRRGLPELLANHAMGGGTSSIDPNWDPSGRWDLDEVMPHTDVLLPNQEEARRLTREEDIESAARSLSSRGPLVAVKQGHAGSLFHDGTHAVQVPAPTAITPIDSTGAGDSFDAGFITGYLEGLNPAGCLALGNACGALSTRATGGTRAQATRPEADALANTLERLAT